jgi:hypothetical protein
MRAAKELEESTQQQKYTQEYDSRDKGKFDKGGRGGRQETKGVYQAKQPDNRGGKGGSKTNLSKS